MSCLDFSCRSNPWDVLLVRPMQKKKSSKNSLLLPEPPDSPQEVSAATDLLRDCAEQGSAINEAENTREITNNPVPAQLVQDISCEKGWQARSELQVEI